MKKFLLSSTIVLLLGTYAKADSSSKVEMTMTVAPYALAIDDDKPFRTAGKVLATQLVATGIYASSPRTINPWALSVTTNAALLCNLQEHYYCGAALLGAVYVMSERHIDAQSTVSGALIGTASGALIPGIVANF